MQNADFRMQNLGAVISGWNHVLDACRLAIAEGRARKLDPPSVESASGNDNDGAHEKPGRTHISDFHGAPSMKARW
jgi:hypothetical protein